MRRVSRRTIDVLAVDDDRETTDALADALTSHGYRISIADNGLQALEYIARNPNPRLIIVGLYMVGMGGVEFLHHRKGSKWQDVPILLLSDVRTPTLLPGWADQILPRSFDLHELLSAVRSKLSK